VNLTIQELIGFEKEIAEIYESGQITGPVHLRNGNEKELIEIFNDVRSFDYVFSTWASHLHALLKGVPPEEIKDSILDGRSITLHFPEHKFYSSAIVGGICPIAVGKAYAINQRKFSSATEGARVFCFIGDMTFLTGIASESIRYSMNHDLPITWVVEDNGVSVGTITEEVWKCHTRERFLLYKNLSGGCKNFDIKYYHFSSDYPHSGTGVFVEF